MLRNSIERASIGNFQVSDVSLVPLCHRHSCLFHFFIHGLFQVSDLLLKYFDLSLHSFDLTSLDSIRFLRGRTFDLGKKFRLTLSKIFVSKAHRRCVHLKVGFASQLLEPVEVQLPHKAGPFIMIKVFWKTFILKSICV